MAYSPPAGNVANFVAGGYYEPGAVRHAYRFPVGVYSEPAGGALVFAESWYAYPPGDAADFGLPPAPTVAVEGTGAATVEITAEGHGTVTIVAVDGDGSATVDITVAGAGAHGVAGSGAAVIDLDISGTGAHGVAGSGAAAIGMSASGVGLVERYELTGQVRKDGILVNRLVRVYRRDTGELVGEQNTTSGSFRIHAGFVAREHYLVPIDTANDATDWLPPCANRVMSVLAQDAA